MMELVYREAVVDLQQMRWEQMNRKENALYPEYRTLLAQWRWTF